MVAFLVGGALALVALLIGFVQVLVAVGKPHYKPALPSALAATAVAFLAGCFLCLGAEFGWLSKPLLDDIAMPIALAALGWVFFNRLTSRVRRRPAPIEHRGDSREPR